MYFEKFCLNLKNLVLSNALLLQVAHKFGDSRFEYFQKINFVKYFKLKKENKFLVN